MQLIAAALEEGTFPDGHDVSTTALATYLRTHDTALVGDSNPTPIEEGSDDTETADDDDSVATPAPAQTSAEARAEELLAEYHGVPAKLNRKLRRKYGHSIEAARTGDSGVNVHKAGSADGSAENADSGTCTSVVPKNADTEAAHARPIDHLTCGSTCNLVGHVRIKYRSQENVVVITHTLTFYWDKCLISPNGFILSCKFACSELLPDGCTRNLCNFVHPTQLGILHTRPTSRYVSVLNVVVWVTDFAALGIQIVIHGDSHIDYIEMRQMPTMKRLIFKYLSPIWIFTKSSTFFFQMCALVVTRLC